MMAKRMNGVKIASLILLAALVSVVGCATARSANVAEAPLVQPAYQARCGLLIVAHGSPEEAWNEQVRRFYESLAKTDELACVPVRLAFMEYAKP
ncbi:MAG TPA: hypothetical protein ENF73_02625, partial [Proteobacteria bacterium]|nr:hypothetical protein [Pseudomonadota bacterium]